MEEIKLKLRQGYREVKGREPTGEMAGMQHFVDFFDVPRYCNADLQV